MEITKEMLENEIKTLQKASKIHSTYSISQYKKVLKALEEVEQRKNSLEEEIKARTKHLEQEIKQKELLANTLENMAKYDQLTSLANRYLFLHELEQIHKNSKPFSLLFIDLDGFKPVNDTYGHDIGDELLQIVARKIKKCVRKNDLVARIGGDEFTIILKNTTNKNTIKKIASNIIKSLEDIIKIQDLSIIIGASIGIYIFNHKDSIDTILSKADLAMYEAKKAGKGRYLFFDNSMQKHLQEIKYLKMKVKYALDKNEFVNLFQPIVSSTDNKIIGAEVLLRLKEKDKLLSPNLFIPILEEDISIIKKVTFWQIQEVAKLTKKTNIFFSINISAKLLNDYDLLQTLKKYIKQYKCNTKQIFLEITESVLSYNLEKAAEILQKITQLGFNISLDDFGTGYSSLAYLRQLPLNTLKIDKTFIDNILSSKKDQKLLESIINIASVFDMQIVMEGIEKDKQLNILPKNKDIKYQGFYFYKPIPLEELLKLIK
jgi:diguanylate cyclase (GGDEF)-like protein